MSPSLVHKILTFLQNGEVTCPPPEGEYASLCVGKGEDLSPSGGGVRKPVCRKGGGHIPSQKEMHIPNKKTVV